MADVYINGEHVGFLWKTPYKNTIEVRVVDMWVTRLIGDAQPDVEGHSYTPIPFYGADSALIPAGLIGPVNIELLR